MTQTEGQVLAAGSAIWRLEFYETGSTLGANWTCNQGLLRTYIHWSLVEALKVCVGYLEGLGGVCRLNRAVIARTAYKVL